MDYALSSIRQCIILAIPQPQKRLRNVSYRLFYSFHICLRFCDLR